MNKINIVKKFISNKDISDNYELFEKNGIRIKEQRLKLTLSNKKDFMKKWTDRKLNLLIDKSLTLGENIFIKRCLDYIDEYNEIHIRKLADDYGYSRSLISQLKKSIINKGLIKKDGKYFYLSPLIGIKTKEINQDLIRLFSDTFSKFGLKIK